jgi:hypothetical protein
MISEQDHMVYGVLRNLITSIHRIAVCKAVSWMASSAGEGVPGTILIGSQKSQHTEFRTDTGM